MRERDKRIGEYEAISGKYRGEYGRWHLNNRRMAGWRKKEVVTKGDEEN